ncbi:MAG: TIGR00304 family protein [Methanothermobacter sp.]|nr:TIGR00304 family protein [Methanothermobacter sp.]
MNTNSLIIVGIILIILGIFLVFAGSIISIFKTKEGAEVKTGGVIMIGPIPIIFGSDRGMAIIGFLMAIILMIVAYILFYRSII